MRGTSYILLNSGDLRKGKGRVSRWLRSKVIGLDTRRMIKPDEGAPKLGNTIL